MSSFLQMFLPYRLSRISDGFSQKVRPVYRDLYGLTRPEWRVLAALADMETATATEIGAHSAQHKTKVSRAVFSLERRRWLTRTVDATDRRSEILRLTAAGVQAYDTLTGPLSARETEILDHLRPEDRAALLQGLAALEHALLSADPGRKNF